VLPASGQEPRGRLGNPLAFEVRVGDGDRPGSADVAVDARQAQAAFFERLEDLVCVAELRIDVDAGPVGGDRQIGLDRFRRRGYVGNEQSERQAHLRGRQPDALGLVHQLDHPVPDRADLHQTITGQFTHRFGLPAEHVGGVIHNLERGGIGEHAGASYRPWRARTGHRRGIHSPLGPGGRPPTDPPGTDRRRERAWRCSERRRATASR